MRNVKVTVEVPELNLRKVDYVDAVEPGEGVISETKMRVPPCADEKEYDALVKVSAPTGDGKEEVFRTTALLEVKQSKTCSKGPVSDTTVVDIVKMHDLTLGGKSSYPFKITNYELRGKSYTLKVKGIEEWGSYEVTTGSVVVLEPGEVKTGELVIHADEGEEVVGEHTFTFSVQSDRDINQKFLTADIKSLKGDRKSSGEVFTSTAYFTAVLLLLLILLAGIGLVFTKFDFERFKSWMESMGLSSKNQDETNEDN